MKVVIVGGAAGGATAAARIRRLDEKAQIIVFERSGFVSYANCGLPYYIGGVIEDPEDLTLLTPEIFWKRFRIDVRVHHEVTSVDTKRKFVTVRGPEKVFEESYDKLLLAPGAKPLTPPVPGMENERIFTLRTVEDALRIRRFIEERQPKTAVVAGGGYIGLEMAENLTQRGIQVTIVQRPSHVLAPLDADMACFVHAKLRQKGVRLMTGHTVSEFAADGSTVLTNFENAAPIRADMALIALGVTPDSKLAKDAGLALGMKDSIAVNDRMETSAPDVYAAGDAAEVSHYITKNKALISLAGPANKQGRIAADNICGGNSRFSGPQGSAVVRIFDMTVAATGINEKTAASAGLDCDKAILSPASHAAYYPGAETMVMKIIWEKGTLRLLGAQIAGYSGTDKRIDVLAAAIHAGMTAVQLKDLDLAYAPPYSSAKDPVNMAGFMAENISGGKVKQLFYEDLSALPQDGNITLLDVRTPAEYSRGFAEGFTNIPLDDLRERLDEIPRDKPVCVMCQSGMRSYLACRILSQNGFDCFNFAGGYRFFEAVESDRQATARS